MSYASKKGDRRERELVNDLHDAGFAVMRAPSSGSATDRDLPDVLCGNCDDFYAIEAKASGGDPIYLDAEEVAALTFFARNFGAEPLLGARFDYCDWYFFHPADCYRTDDAGNYRIKEQTAVEEGTHFDDLVGGAE